MSTETPITMEKNPFIDKEIENVDQNHIITKWDELNIDPNILRGIFSYGFENPSPIQSKAIIPISLGKDIIAQAQSGTGKTAAFTIGALSRIDLTQNTNQVLILSPTHELSTQITNVIKDLSSMMSGINIKTLIGGSSIESDVEDMKENVPHIIVGCPGRVYDMIKRRHIKVSTMKLIILDEADEMLSAGFKEQIYNIFQYLNKNTQIALFSATLPPNIYTIANKFMRDPIRISVAAERLSLEGIRQYYIAVEDDRQKYLTLKDIYQFISLSQCIIYCNSIKRVINLYEAMKEDNFPVCCIHSDMDKNERHKAFMDFRSGSARVLISSNVTARGIDIQQVSVVINFDVPKDIHTYIHRIGRSGRWGRKGTGINFITRRDVSKIREIEQYYNCQIDELPANFTC
jgi:translation initiation factor 4A